MIPKITLIGQSNVGKSSLFNLLTNSNNSLIDSSLHTTRDRNHGYFEIQKKKFCIIDTAGIEYLKKKDQNSIKYQSCKQTNLAIQEANLIIFIVNANKGITNLDLYILKKIRKKNKPIILLINKIDILAEKNETVDFYNFGIKKIYKISVLQKIGIDDFLNKLLIFWINLNKKKSFTDSKYILAPAPSLLIKKKIKVCFIGKPNVGKSSIINSLVNKERIIVTSEPGSTRDTLQVIFRHKNIEYIFTDTAGIRKKNKRRTRLDHVSEIRSLQTIKKNQIIVVVIDSYIGICAQDLSILYLVTKSQLPFFIVFNKWDLISKNKQEKIKKIINFNLKFIKNVKILYISALFKIGLNKIFFQINLMYKESLKNFNPSYLTKIIQKAIVKHPLPMGAKGKVIRLKYAHLISKTPMSIIVHGKQTHNISRTYKRYLMHFLQKELQIPNTPIQIFFKNNINPYTSYKN